MTFVHDYSGSAGRCHRCGASRREGAVMMCELPEDLEFEREVR